MRYGLRAQLLAWCMAREGGKYPAFVRDRKNQLLEGLTGTLLEIGAGAGANLRLLPAAVKVVALEPNPFMHPYLLAEARRQERPVALVQGRAEALPFPDESLDAVLSTLVLCSVRTLDGSLGEVVRVLKPGGRFLFMEHVAAPKGSWLGLIQGLLTPAWRRLGDGCRLDRDTEAHLVKAGFKSIRVDRFAVPVPLVSPHIAGVAYK